MVATMIETRKMKPALASVSLDVSTFNETENTVEVVFATEAKVLRRTWDEKFYEVLSCNSSNVRLERLNSGGPVVDTHGTYSLKDQFGVVAKAWVDDTSKQCRAILKLSTRDEWKGIVNDIKLGIIRNISVGYRIYAGEMKDASENDIPVFTVTDWEPTEVTFCPVPADFDSGTRSNNDTENDITITKISNKNTMTAQEKQTRDAAINDMVRTLNLGDEFANTLIANDALDIDGARTLAVAEVGKRADAAKPTNVTLNVEQVRKEERIRATEIRKAGDVAGLTNEEVSEIVSSELNLDQARAAIIDKAATKQPKINSMNNNVRVGADEVDKFRAAGIDGLMLRAGVAPADITTERRNSAGNLATMSLVRMAEECLLRAGVKNHYDGGTEEMVKRAITTSTSDFPVLLGGVIRQVLLANYATVEDTWRKWCSVGSVVDFRAHDRLRMGSFSRLDRVLENGSLKNKPIKDAYKETIKADTFGNIINVSRKTIINDDLGFITRLAGLLGRAAGLSIEEDVYALLAENPVMGDGIALFHADHNNIGTSAAISVNSFEEMAVLMAEQKDPNGNEYIGARPSVLLTNTAQAGNARVINGSQYDPDAANKLQRVNKSFGLFSTIVDTPRVDSTSKKAYYAFANPAMMPTFEVAFLNGVQVPRLENRMGFEVEGMEWKVVLDYGVAAIDWRGAVKNANV